ncbi:MAG: PIG-L family deacetylase, partial [Acidimicrobiales bacterium]
MLGYRDSGMPGTPENEDGRCFARAELSEAIGRLVAVIRRVRPQVLITYPDDQEGYPHPDHLQVHAISLPAFESAGDPDAYPEAGPPWRPSKLYYSLWARARIVAMHEKFLELGLESPFDDKWFSRPAMDDRITTRIDLAGHQHVSGEALRAHATQVDPASPFWFGLPSEVARDLYPFEDFQLAASRVEAPIPEDDLFAGLRAASERRVGTATA